MDNNITKLHFDVQGMTCAACQAHVTRAVEKLDGTKNVNVSLLTNDMYVDVDTNKVDIEKIENAVKDAGYSASIAEDTINDLRISSPKNKENYKTNKSYVMKNRVQESNDNIIKYMKKRLTFSIIFWILLMIISMHHMINIKMPIFDGIENSLIFAFTQFLFVIPIIIVNLEMIKSGFKSLSKMKPNMDALVALGSSASMIYGIFAIYKMCYGFGHNNFNIVEEYRSNLYFESAGTILTLITVGKYLEARSKGKTGDAISKLIDLAPKKSVVVISGNEEIIPSEEIVEGDIIVIKPGNSIPVDGIVVEGVSSVDESSITGESIPVEKVINSKVTSGTINKNGTFKMKALKVGDETTLARIVKLVEDASVSKAPIENIADNVAGVFVPIVIVISIITFLAWVYFTKNVDIALDFAISVLVISCPCALGLATPLAIMVGIGKGADNNILIKDAKSLQALANVKTVMFDKTGTITTGKPKVTDIVTNIDKNNFLKIAGTIEISSEHPLAEAIIEKAKEANITLEGTEKFERIPGKGVKAILDGVIYYSGNAELMIENNIDISSIKMRANELLNQGKTVLYFARDNNFLGIIAVRDEIKGDSKDAINILKNKGIKTIMITGDNKIVAKNIADEIGIDEFFAEVMPDEKENIVKKIQKAFAKKGSKVAFVGDGINDSPALTKADIGIAVGSGTDIAIESADIILVKNSIMDVVTAVELSYKTLKNIKENLFWAFFYNIICIPVAAGVFYNSFELRLNPMLASAAMAFSSLFVCLNALRLRLFKSSFYKTSGKDNKSKHIMEYRNINKQNENDENDNTNDKKVQVKERKKDIMKKEIKIDGMMCQNCVMHVTKALENIDGISNVNVSLHDKRAIVDIDKNVTDDTIKNAIKDAGYMVTEIVTK